MKSKLPLYSLISSFSVLGYILLVALLMSNGNELFGNMPSIISFVAFLMLFVLSALITGLLVLGGPIYLYFENKKPDALKLLAYNVGWMVMITITVLAALAIIRFL